MPYKFIMTEVIPATPQEIYDAWLDSERHTAMTGGEATASPKVGGSFTAWDGYIWGTNLDLAPGGRIVQSWRTTQFTDEHEDSVVTVMLTEFGEGTLVTLEHANVPDDQRGYEESGWREHYFAPMKAYFGGAKAGTKKKPAGKRAAAKKKAVKKPGKKKAAAKKKTATRKTKRTKKAAATRKAAKPRKSAAKSRRKAAKPKRKSKRKAARAKR